MADGKPGRPKGTQGHTRPPAKYVKKWVKVPARSISPATQQRMVAVREKQAQALELRKAGATYQEIAQALGYKHASGASDAVKRAIERIGIEPAVEVVQMDLMRLDEFQKRCTAALRNGDLSQIDRLMRIMRERRELLGFDPVAHAEEARMKGKDGITNNGVMVIQGSSADFVQGMMEAIGIDPNSEEAKIRLEKIRTEEKEKGVGEFAVAGPKPNELFAASADGALNHKDGAQQGKIIAGEIVEAVEKDIEDD